MHGTRKASITKKLRKGLSVSKKRNLLSFVTFLGKYTKKQHIFLLTITKIRNTPDTEYTRWSIYLFPANYHRYHRLAQKRAQIQLFDSNQQNKLSAAGFN
jgi:phosphatidylserine decarboxylase